MVPVVGGMDCNDLSGDVNYGVSDIAHVMLSNLINSQRMLLSTIGYPPYVKMQNN